MLPEVRVVIQRAEMRRASLEELFAAIPEGYWHRRSPDDEWTAETHLRHLATVDDLLVEMLSAIEAGAREVRFGGADTGRSEDPRIDAMRSLEGFPVEHLVERMRGSRSKAVGHIGRLDAGGLESTILLGGAVDAWGTPFRWPLRSYLASWVDHDGVHAGAIREAVSSPPDLSTVMLTHRRADP